MTGLSWNHGGEGERSEQFFLPICESSAGCMQRDDSTMRIIDRQVAGIYSAAASILT